jgi:hypothetical protein
VSEGGLLPLAFEAEEVFAALAFGAGDLAEVVAAGLKFGEETADLGGELFGGAEVEGELTAVGTVGEAVVGSAAPAIFGAVGGDDGAAAGEEGGVSADEVEGRHGRGQRSEGRGQRSEGRGQRSEVRGQRAEGRGQRAEGRGQRAEGRGQRAAWFFVYLIMCTVY